LVTVPAAALATRDGRSVVFEVADGKARQRVVVTGPARQDQIVVRQGLAGTETLVSRPPEALRDGDAVKVKG